MEGGAKESPPCRCRWALLVCRLGVVLDDAASSVEGGSFLYFVDWPIGARRGDVPHADLAAQVGDAEWRFHIGKRPAASLTSMYFSWYEHMYQTSTLNERLYYSSILLKSQYLGAYYCGLGSLFYSETAKTSALILGGYVFLFEIQKTVLPIRRERSSRKLPICGRKSG